MPDKDAEIAALKAEVARLAKQVIGYSTHDGGCGHRYGHDCDCGLQEARRHARALLNKDKTNG